MSQFVIFGLPRSRTFWLSRLLGYGPRACGHDIAIESDNLDAFAATVAAGGTVETGAVVAWPALRRKLPDARFFVIRRPTDEVAGSLARFGIEEPELAQRAAMLDALSEAPGTVTIQHEALSDGGVLAWLFEAALGVPFDPGWCAAMARTNLQVEMPARLARIAERRPAIEALKAEARRLGGIAPQHAAGRPVIAVEPWGSARPGILGLAPRHWDEVEAQMIRPRPLALDDGLLSRLQAAGAFLVVTARLDGRMVGYLTWSLSPDAESAGTLIATQGIWYLEPGHSGVAHRMFERSIAELKLRGVAYAHPHHRAVGRGKALGKFFRRRGAVPEHQTYTLRIGD